MSVAYGASPGFAQAAEQQQDRPKYGVMGDAQIQLYDRSQQAPPQSFDGALDVTMDQVGAENTPGYQFDAATQACTQLITGAGLQKPTDPNAGTAGALYGVACISTAMLVASLEHAPAL